MNRPYQLVAGWGLLALGAAALFLALPGFGASDGVPPTVQLFGWAAAPVAAALAATGAALLLAPRFGWRPGWAPIAWAEVAFLALLGFLHSFMRDMQTVAMAGDGGGVVGWSVAQLPVDLLGRQGARAVLAATAALGILQAWRQLPGERFLTSGPLTGGVMAGLAAARARLARPASPSPVAPAKPKPVPARAAKSPAPPAPASGAAPEAKPRKAKASSEPAVAPERGPGLPGYDLLRAEGAQSAGSADARHRAQLIRQTLDEFGVPVEVVSIKEGPTVTQFGLLPGEVIRELKNGDIVRRRVSVQSILRLSNDLALALSAPSLRIEAPVPGRPYVGIEVPNPGKSLVSLRNILESREFVAIKSPLTLALGRDVSGDPVVADLARMPHLLIAGATGSGKSVCINALVCSLLMNNGPDTIRFLMMDPKMVELPAYNGTPHLIGQVITDPEHSTAALAWLLAQMDDRYRLFAERRVRNIAEHNRKAVKIKGAEPLPYLVLVIDELADLMMTAAADIERQICRLAQMSRATGIHLILATQRPSVDVITGLIKANFPSRIAFAVTSQVDSRVILDAPGAEKLLGRGDMLYMAPESSKLARIQGCFVSDQEIERVVTFWRNAAAAQDGGEPEAPWQGYLNEEGRDPLLEQAIRLLAVRNSVSTSLLQRQLRVGFPRAARLMEQLEEMGYVGPEEGGGRSREVYYREDAMAEATRTQGSL